jgi:hypothetical protein
MTMVCPAESRSPAKDNWHEHRTQASPHWPKASAVPKPCSLPVSSAYRWMILRARARYPTIRLVSVPGIYAAGDLATPFLPSVTLASSQGAMAGIFAQQSMLV